MKICSKCKVNKEDTEFWVRKNRGSGLNSECKSCCSNRRKSLDKDVINEKRKEYYYENREHLLKLCSESQKRCKERVNEYHREWYEENKEKLKAQRALQKDRHNEWAKKYTKLEHVKEKKRANALLLYNVQNGNVIKPETCQGCGKKVKIEGHHHDYNKPLDVIWVCRKCHVAIHRSLKEANNAS